MGLIRIEGYEVQNGSGELLGPLLMDSAGSLFVIDLELKEAFPVSNYPECKIIKL